MPQMTNSSKRAGAVLGALLLVLASLALAACGGSSKTSSTNASASASTSGAPGKPGAPATSPREAGPAVAHRFAALRECLQKNGITLPKRSPGQRPAPGGLLGGGSLPKGVTRAQFEAVLKKCGGNFRGGNFTHGFNGGAHFNSPAVKQALNRFAACMRENGVDVPAPNTSGKGPIFNTNGLNTASSTFRAAEAKCRSDLQGAFRASPGGSAAAPGSPPTGG
jgi:hypothetical protein